MLLIASARTHTHTNTHPTRHGSWLHAAPRVYQHRIKRTTRPRSPQVDVMAPRPSHGRAPCTWPCLCQYPRLWINICPCDASPIRQHHKTPSCGHTIASFGFNGSNHFALLETPYLQLRRACGPFSNISFNHPVLHKQGLA